MSSSSLAGVRLATFQSFNSRKRQHLRRQQQQQQQQQQQFSLDMLHQQTSLASIALISTQSIEEPPQVHQRNGFTREASLSPLRVRAQSASRGRRFSHSRGRPPTTGSSIRSTTADSIRSESVGSEAGSRAPLWRLYSSSSSGSNGSESAHPEAAGAPHRQGEHLHPTQATASPLELKPSAASSSTTVAEVKVVLLLAKFPPIFAHFLGYRPAQPLDSKFLTPFSFLPARIETIFLSWLGAFVSILLGCAISSLFAFQWDKVPLAIGLLGATAVLLYAVPEGPLSQPRALIGGHLLSAFTGTFIGLLFSLSPHWNEMQLAAKDEYTGLVPLASALAVATSIAVMQLTKTVHPPGGATALIAVTQTQRWPFILLITTTVSTMGLWAMLINNLGRGRRYPVYWWEPLSIPSTVKASPSSPSSISPQTESIPLTLAPSTSSINTFSQHSPATEFKTLEPTFSSSMSGASREEEENGRWLGPVGEEIESDGEVRTGEIEGDEARGGEGEFELEEQVPRGRTLAARRR